MKKVLLGLFLFMFFFSSISLAWRWCCSWHWWQAYCGSNWMWICNDWTQSPSCTCSSPSYNNSYSAPSRNYISCPSHSSLVNWICECFVWYKPWNNNTTCIEDKDYTCNQKWMIYDSISDSCTCKYWESWNSYSEKCIINDIWCQKAYGSYSESSYWTCLCKDGYKMNDDWDYCIKKGYGIGWRILSAGILWLYRRNKRKEKKNNSTS